jgi:hypothetical protein
MMRRKESAYDPKQTYAQPPHVSSLHPPSRFGVRQPGKREVWLPEYMPSYGFGFFTRPLPQAALNSSAEIEPLPSTSAIEKLTM